jgi:uncharacterized membrane protein (DUF373 family)
MTTDSSERQRRRRIGEFRDNWRTLGFYERFEQVIALTLTTLIAVVVVIATWDLAKAVFLLTVGGLMDPFEPSVLQTIFGRIMLVLIALEFKHSILRVVAHRGESIAQVKTVLLIALLAISRKFIVLDAASHPPSTIVALAAVVLALGITYWLVRSRDDATR